MGEKNYRKTLIAAGIGIAATLCGGGAPSDIALKGPIRAQEYIVVPPIEPGQYNDSRSNLDGPPTAIYPGCGQYPDLTNDPLLPEQKMLINNRIYDADGNEYLCPNSYAAYTYIVSELENRIPIEERRRVSIVFMDSGIDIEHPDWCNDTFNLDWSRTFIGHLPPNLSPFDPDYPHGTQVASAGNACSENGEGQASYGKNMDMISIRIMFPFPGLGGIVNNSDWVKGMNYLKTLAENNQSNIFVINMSFGGFSFNQDMQDLILSFPSNVVFVAAAGNTQYGFPEDNLLYPAAYERVISVGGGVDEQPNTLCHFSRYASGDDNFTVGPGCYDISAFNLTGTNNGLYASGLAGTSLSAGIFSGFFAKMIELFPSLDPQIILRTIYDTSLTVTSSTNGEINGDLKAFMPLFAIQSLAVLAGHPDLALPPTPTPTPSPEPTPTITQTPSPTPTPQQTQAYLYFFPYVSSPYPVVLPLRESP